MAVEKNKVRKPIVDFILSLTVSKKLSIMIVVIFALFYDKIDSDNFTWIAMIYMGVEGLNNLLKIWAGSKGNSDNNNNNNYVD